MQQKIIVVRFAKVSTYQVKTNQAFIDQNKPNLSSGFCPVTN